MINILNNMQIILIVLIKMIFTEIAIKILNKNFMMLDNKF